MSRSELEAGEETPLPASAEAPPSSTAPVNATQTAKPESAKAEVPASLPDALRLVAMQDKIIEALQRDNEGFVSEKRNLISRVKELEDALANLEAKHSLMLSAQGTHERDKMSTVDTEGTVAKLKAHINELEFLLEEAADANKALETELSRHKNCSTTLQIAEAEIQNLNVALRRMEKEQQKNVEEMAKRIQSFTEEGNYNAEMEARLREQERIIHQLKTQIADGGASEKQKRGSSGAATQSKELHALHRRIVELEEQLRQKSTESVADLIRSCQPSAQDSKLFKRQEAHIEQLKEALSAKDKFTEAALERLRLESAQVRRQYEEKLLEAETKVSHYQRTERDQQSKVRELEKEVHSLRRDLATASAQVGSMVHPVHTSHAEGDGVKMLTEENNILRERVRSLEAIRSAHSTGAEHSATVEALQALVRSLTEEVAAYKKLSEESQRITQETNDRAERRVLQWKQEMVAQIQSAREEYNREIERLQRAHQSELVRALERQVSDSGSNGDVAQQWRSILDERGQEGFLSAVLDRLQFLERRYRQKEKEFLYELAETRRNFELEHSADAQKYELNLERKNQQINDFRTQLDQLLSSVALLSAQAS